MEIKIASKPKAPKKPQSIYQIKIESYHGDADGYKTSKFLVKPDKLEQMMLEILFVDNQFDSGRGGCRTMYDQLSYFNSSDVKTEGYFDWLDDFPYDSDGEQNYTIDSYTITYFDENSLEYDVKVSKIEDVIKDIKKMNKKFKIGDYDEWDGLDNDDEKFHNYHQAVIAYIEKYVLESKVSNKEAKNNKNKIKV